MQPTCKKEVGYSLEELAALKIPNNPATSEGWRLRANAEEWAFIEVKSRGRGGKKRLYFPPESVVELIDKMSRGELSANKPYPLGEQGVAPTVEESINRYGADNSANDEGRRDLLEAVLRVAEHKIRNNQVTKAVIDFGLEGAPSWLEAARSYPDLELRLRNMVATFKFLAAADETPPESTAHPNQTDG